MIFIDETRTKKKLVIRKEDGIFSDAIVIKFKHIPIFLMMIQKHYGEFSEGESFGKHEVVKRENGLDTIVKKKGCSDASSKYAIGNYDDIERLYGLDFEDYLVITEDESKDLILQLADYYIKVMNEEN